MCVLLIASSTCFGLSLISNLHLLFTFSINLHRLGTKLFWLNCFNFVFVFLFFYCRTKPVQSVRLQVVQSSVHLFSAERRRYFAVPLVHKGRIKFKIVACSFIDWEKLCVWKRRFFGFADKSWRCGKNTIRNCVANKSIWPLQMIWIRLIIILKLIAIEFWKREKRKKIWILISSAKGDREWNPCPTVSSGTVWVR